MRSIQRKLALASLSLCFGMGFWGTGCGDGGSDSDGGMDMDTDMDMSDDGGGKDTGKNGKDTDTGMSSDKSSTEGGSKLSVKPEKGSIDCSALKAEGNKKGKVGPEVKLSGADGEEYNLHDYCNSAVVVVMGGAH